MTDWPTHPDGRRLTVGEMTPEQRRDVFAEAVRRLQGEFDMPAMQAKLEAILRGDRVDQ